MKEKKHKLSLIFLCLVLVFSFVFIQHIPTKAADEITVKNLQTVINDSSNRNIKLTLKKNTYEIENTLLMPSNVEIDFNGSTIKRKKGSGVYDLIRNSDTINGNKNIKICNLVLDGNKDIDSLTATDKADRFGGLVLKKVKNSELKNIIVTATVNAEDTAGIYFEDCSDIYGYRINGYNNDRTAILATRSKVKINESVTYNNLGSGIGSKASDECEYNNIKTYNNGYSNLSINGKRCKINNVLSYGSAYSGVNVGHISNPSDDTILLNVHSYDNGYEGLTIAGSSGVQVIGLEVYGNVRNNIQIKDNASSTKLLNVVSKNSGGTSAKGIIYKSGKNHYLDSAEIFGNAGSGVYVDAGVSVNMGSSLKCYNNGKKSSSNSAGIVLNSSVNCTIMKAECYDDQSSKTQETGIWIAGGSGHSILLNNCHDNKTYQIRETNSSHSVRYLNNIQRPFTK